jgi:anti-sigma B factor antagonist
MSFKLEDRPGCTIVHFETSKLDTLNARDLKAQMDSVVGGGKANLVFDLSNVRFMESSGMALLLHTNRLCKEHDGKLVNFGAQSLVWNVIKTSQLDKVLDFAEDEGQAVARFS